MQAMFAAELDEVLARSLANGRGRRAPTRRRRPPLVATKRIDGARCWARSGKWRSQCRAPG